MNKPAINISGLRAVLIAFAILSTSLFAAGCGSDDGADLESTRDGELRRGPCGFDNPKICQAASQCRWVDPVGCLSNAKLPGDPLPEKAILQGEFHGEFLPAQSVIGHGHAQRAMLSLKQQDDLLFGDLTVEIHDGQNAAQLQFRLSGRVLDNEIALAFTHPTCTPLAGKTACDQWYHPRLDLPERFVTRGFMKDYQLFFGPGTPRNPAQPAPLFDSMRMHPHDGFKPSTDDPDETAELLGEDDE